MALINRTLRIVLNASLLLVILVSVLINPLVAGALGNGNALLPKFADFSKTVQNGEAGALRGVYVADVLALPIVQQPASNAGYVSLDDGKATQFSLASKSFWSMTPSGQPITTNL